MKKVTRRKLLIGAAATAAVASVPLARAETMTGQSRHASGEHFPPKGYKISEGDTKKYNIDNGSIALMGFSPVSYIDLNAAQEGNPNIFTKHDNVYYFFVDEAQQEKFQADPEKYLPQYGGFCAQAMTHNAKFRVHPFKFSVEGGLLYVFAYDFVGDGLVGWRKAGGAGVQKSKADKNWVKLQQEC